MDCCDTSKAYMGCQNTFPELMSPGMRRQAASIMAYIGAVVAPEPTDPPPPFAGPHESRFFAIVKTSVWFAIAIGIGVALATVCS